MGHETDVQADQTDSATRTWVTTSTLSRLIYTGGSLLTTGMPYQPFNPSFDDASSTSPISTPLITTNIDA